MDEDALIEMKGRHAALRDIVARLLAIAADEGDREATLRHFAATADNRIDGFGSPKTPNDLRFAEAYRVEKDTVVAFARKMLPKA